MKGVNWEFCIQKVKGHMLLQYSLARKLGKQAKSITHVIVAPWVQG